MPNHVNQRTTRLRELVQQGLHEENLDRAVQECNSLAQDSPHVLVFFTLKSIFKELAETLESGAIEVQRYEELVKGVSEKVSALLQKLLSENAVAANELEDLVRTHTVNRNLFRS
jgi:chaperonin cofactor prefoldin